MGRMTDEAATKAIAAPTRPGQTRSRRPGELTTGNLLLGLAPAALVLLAVIIYPLAHSLWLTLHSWNLLTNQIRLGRSR